MIRSREYFRFAVLTALLFVALFRPWDGRGYDNVFYYSYLSSPFFDGDLDVANDVALSNNSVSAVCGSLLVIGPRGRVLNQFAIGSGVLWLPAFAPVRGLGALATFAGFPGADWAADRFSTPYLMALSLASVGYGFLTLLLVYATCRMLFRRGPSELAAIAMVFASPLLGYMYIFGTMSHTGSAFTVALLVYLSLRFRKFDELGSYAMIGAAWALVVLVRWQDVILGLLPATLWLQNLARKREQVNPRRELAGVALAAGVALSLFTLQFCYWKATLGSFITVPQGNGFMKWGEPEFMKVLFSGYHGLFYWHPATAAAVLGLGFMVCFRPTRLIGAVLFAVLLLVTYINACVMDWFAGSSFGGRRFSSVLPLLALCLAALLNRLGRRALTCAAVLCGLLVAANVVLLAAFDYQMSDAYFLGDLREMGVNAVRPAMQFLLGLPLHGYIGTTFVLEGRGTRAVVVLLSGLGLIGLITWLASFIRHTAVQRFGGRFCAAVGGGALAASTFMLLHPLSVDPLGLKIAELSGIAISSQDSWTRRNEIVTLLLRSNCRNPAVPIIAAQEAMGSATLASSLKAVRSIEPRLWARWISELPKNETTPNDRRAAERLQRRTFRNAWEVCVFDAAKCRLKGHYAKEAKWLNLLLRQHPFDRGAVDRLAELKTGADSETIQRLLDTRLKYIQARVRNFQKFRHAIAPLEQYYFRLSIAPFAEELVERNTRSGTFGAAAEACSLLAEMHPDAPSFRVRHLTLRAKNGEPVGDLRWTWELLDDPASSPAVIADLVDLYLTLGSRPDVIRVLQTGLNRFPDDASLSFQLGLTLADPESGRDLLDSASAAQVASSNYWVAVAEAYARAGDFPACERYARQALSFSDTGHVNFVVGQGLFLQNRVVESIPFYRKAFEKQPEFAATGRMLAVALEDQGRRDEAWRVLELAMKRHPGDPDLMAVRSRLEGSRAGVQPKKD